MNKCSDYQRVFQHFDEDGDGKLSPTELRRCVGAACEEVLLMEDVEAVVEFLDSDGDGLLGLEDFVGLMESESEERKMEDLREAFGVYEMDGCECITPRSLKRTLSQLGESKTIDECVVMINHFDIDGDGVLSFDEFRAMMLQ